MLRLTATASEPSDRLFSDVLPVVIVLAAVVLVGAMLIYVARRAARASDSASQAGFTLQDLRDLHRTGKLTDDEFERAKQLMIGRLTGSDGGTEPVEHDR